MSHSHFTDARAWVFDLDNTLYHPSARLFDLIIEKMNAYMMRELGIDLAEAQALRGKYWRAYGTTLKGLMEVNGIDPAPFLFEVHDIDLSALKPDPELRAALLSLPGRKIVYTNGSRGHADQVLKARGLLGIFDARYGVEDAGFAPKPERQAFERVFATDGIEAKGAVMVEDDIRNLKAPREMGMKTLWVTENPAPHEDVDAATDNLTRFLNEITGAMA